MYHAYPGGIDAAGERAWKRFGPSSHPAGGEDMQIKIATPAFVP